MAPLRSLPPLAQIFGALTAIPVLFRLAWWVADKFSSVWGLRDLYLWVTNPKNHALKDAVSGPWLPYVAPFFFYGIAAVIALALAARKAHEIIPDIPLLASSLRGRALPFGKQLRDFYEQGKSDPEMPMQFFIRFYADICDFKDRFSAAIGPKNVEFLAPSAAISQMYNLHYVEWVIFTFNREAAQVAPDIPW